MKRDGFKAAEVARYFGLSVIKIFLKTHIVCDQCIDTRNIHWAYLNLDTKIISVFHIPAYIH